VQDRFRRLHFVCAVDAGELSSRKKELDGDEKCVEGGRAACDTLGTKKSVEETRCAPEGGEGGRTIVGEVGGRTRENREGLGETRECGADELYKKEVISNVGGKKEGDRHTSSEAEPW
jgi:hypothetical protein